MKWKMSHRSNDRAHKVIEMIQGDLGEYVGTREQIAVAKVALSDQKDGKARGVLYYWNDEDPPAARATKSWGVAGFTTHNDYDGMYEDALRFLNGETTVDGVTLQLHQAAGARVGFSNRKGSTSHLAIYYPKD